jgi:hypothetical protein
MAIIKGLTMVQPSGIELNAPNAYIRIEDYNGNKGQFSFVLRAYKDQSSVNAYAPFKQWSFMTVVDLESTRNFLQQSYDWVKTLPEFTGAIDA